MGGLLIRLLGWLIAGGMVDDSTRESRTEQGGVRGEGDWPRISELKL